MNELERENKRLRAVVEELNSTVLDNTAQIEQENAELRKKAEAWDLFEKVMGVSEVIFFRTEEGWCIWSSGYIGFNYGPTPYDAFMVAYNALNKDEDGEE